MESRILIGQIGHMIAALFFGWLVIVSYRWIRRRSEVVGLIFATAILGRVLVGLALFWTSYLELPVAHSLQVSGGFWQPALDATGYYHMAASAADSGTLYPLSHPGPSTFFLNALALWMLAVGVSPAAGMFLNLCLYTALVVMIVWCFAPANQWRRDWPCIVGVGAYSFSPAVVIHSTQPLKDELSSVLIAMTFVGVLAFRRLIHPPLTRRRPWVVVAGAVVVSAGIFGIAGIRSYYAFMIWCALASMLGTFAIRGRTAPLRRYLVASSAVLTASWLAFWIGAGPFYEYAAPDLEGNSVVAVVRSIAAIPVGLMQRATSARTGFVRSGGATQTDAPETNLRTGREHVLALAKGLVFVFVPVSVIDAVSSFDVEGGRGLMSIVDVDTVFLDVTSLMVLGVLWRRRHTLGDRLPLVVFGLILSGATAVLLAYVVTNYGTLWRLRPLFAVPLWLLVIALSQRVEQRSDDVSDRRSP